MPYHLLIFSIRNAVRETPVCPKVNEWASTPWGKVTSNISELDSDSFSSSEDLGSPEISLRP
ncbi:hypothetical protein GCM10009847_23750 [Leucobacter tardus]